MANESGRVSRRVAVPIVALMVAVPALYVALSLKADVMPESSVGSSAPAKDVAKFEQAAGDASGGSRINRSIEYIQKGAPGRAVPVLKDMLRDNPKDVIAWNNLCVAYMGLQEFNHAVDACEAGERLDASMQLLKNNRKWAKDETAKARTAVTVETRKPRDQRDVASYMAEAMNRLHLGEYGEAQAAWYECLAKDPRNALAQNNIGVALMMLNKPAEAAESFQKAIKLNPATPLYQNNLAWAQGTK